MMSMTLCYDIMVLSSAASMMGVRGRDTARQPAIPGVHTLASLCSL
jgi:hypothetical protein